MRLIAGAVLLSATVGCQAIADRFGDQDEGQPLPQSALEEAPGELEADPSDAAAETGKEPKKPRRKKKGGRKKKGARAEVPELAPPAAEALELQAALARAVVRGEGGAPTRLDPFVLTLLVETLERDEGRPFSRTTKAQRKAGIPAGLKVGVFADDSLWARLGLREGDYVLAVGSARPPGPKHSRALLKTLSLAPQLTVELQRNGRQKKLEFEVVPGLAWRTYLEQEANRTFPVDTPAASPRPAGSKPSARSPGGSPKSKPAGGSKPAPTSTPLRVTCSGSTCSIPKSDFDRLVGSSSRVKKEARGKSMGSGYQLTFVGPGARKAGFRVGDVIREINGKSTKNTLQMLSLYGGLKSTRKFRVKSTRGSTRRTTTILVKS